MKQEREGSIQADGETIELGQLIKSGGAGSVYLLPHRGDSVAKLYHPTIDRAVYERKVEAMLALVPDLPDRVERGRRYVQIAWPTALARDGRRRFLGFLMPLLDIAATAELEPVLQERQALAQGLPTALGAKITLAANLASVLTALHRQQHYVVDLKPVNLRFYRDSLYIALLDCDGFSIHGPGGQRFHAQQYTPDYLAPEFQANGLDARGELAQDLFALAVVIFQLLNFGIHPYTGQPRSERVPTDIPGRIRAGCYAYGRRPHPDMAPSPASCHALLPDELRALFDRAFQSRMRPTAAEWAEQLGHYARPSSGLLVPCQRNPKHQHFVGLDCPACARAGLLERVRRQPQPRRPRRARAQAASGQAAATSPAQGAARPPSSGWSALAYIVVPVMLLWLLMRSCSHTTAPHTPPNTVTTSTMSMTASTTTTTAPPIQPVAQRPRQAVIQGDVQGLLGEARLADASAFRASFESFRQRAAALPRAQGASLAAYYAAMADDADRSRRGAALRAIVDADPYASFAAAELGTMELLRGDRQAGRMLYAQAAWTAPDDPAYWYGLAMSYAGEDDGRAIAAMAISEWLAGRNLSAVRIRFDTLSASMSLAPATEIQLRGQAHALAQSLRGEP
jgi:hypothetical protein